MLIRSLAMACALAFAASAASAESLLERGTYLVRGIVACGNCHTPQTPAGPQPGMEFAGALVADEAAMKAFAGNITPDRETGIGTWTDEQIGRAIRDGVRPDGSLIGPPMPFAFYRNISDDDLVAIIAYVRSVTPVRNAMPKSTYNIPLPPAWGPPVGKVAAVSRDNPLAYGAYMAGPLGHCLECHSSPVNGVPDAANHAGAGGMEFHGPWGVSIAANITPHPKDGIAHYSDADLKKVIQTGVRPNGTRLLPPMGVAYYASIGEADMNALVAYLRTLKPLPTK